MTGEQLDREISIIYDLLFGYTDKMKNLRRELNPEDYRLPVKAALAVKIDNYSLVVEGMSDFRRDELKREIHNLMKKAAGSYFKDILSAPVEEDTFVLFYSPSERNRSEILKFAGGLRETLEKETGLSFSLGLGREYQDLKGLIYSYQEALNACNNAQFLGEGVKHINDLIVFKKDIPIFISELENRLFRKIKAGELQDIEELFAEIIETIITERIEPETAKMRIMNLFFRIIRESRQDEKGSDSALSTILPYIEKLLEVNNKKNFCRLTADLSKKIFTTLKSEQDFNNKQEIKQALKYIQENYQQELSLKEVSEEVGLSLYYFSHLFKEETGQTFVTYLNRVRIEKARKMLVETNLNISEICYQVGYNDPNYFARVFKEYERVTPSKYREENIPHNIL